MSVPGKTPPAANDGGSASIETPVLAVGRRIVDAWARQEYHDGHSMEERRKRPSGGVHDRMAAAALEEFFGLQRYVCGLPGQTLSDALIQLNAAAHLADYIEGSENGLGEDHQRDLRQVITAMATTIRLLAAVPEILPPDIPLDDFTTWADIKPTAAPR